MTNGEGTVSGWTVNGERGAEGQRRSTFWTPPIARPDGQVGRKARAPSPHLTDYPVDDLHALYLVYVGQCWHPTLSRTKSAWRREQMSDGKFKYAVIDARFEYKGRSLYERAILCVGKEVDELAS
jgi:hypothetical protein